MILFSFAIRHSSAPYKLEFSIASPDMRIILLELAMLGIFVYCFYKVAVVKRFIIENDLQVLQEIKKTVLKQSFTKITRLYDYTWYGNFPIDEARYNTAEKAFLQLQKMINANA